MDRRFSPHNKGDSSRNSHNGNANEHRKAARTSSCDVFDLACKVRMTARYLIISQIFYTSIIFRLSDLRLQKDIDFICCRLF